LETRAMIEELEALAVSIMEKQRAWRKAKHAKVYEPRSTTASSLGYRCDRRLVYARTQPHYARPIGEELSSIFEEGDLHQADVRRELIELGHEALEAERSFRDEGLEIGARIDGKLALTNEHRSVRVPLEIKSTTGPPPMTAMGLKHHHGIHAREYAQMQTYLYLDGSEAGMFLFKDKITGLWWLVVVPIDYVFAEDELLRKAERVRDHIKAGTLPDRIADRSECQACPFNDSICLPAEAPADQLLLVDDTNLLTDIERREELAPLAREFKKLDEEIKTRFNTTAGSAFVVGDENGWLVEKKKHGKGTRLNIKRLTTTAA
jgi:hypothetical protein